MNVINMNLAQPVCILLLQALICSGYFNWVSFPRNVPLLYGKIANLTWVYQTNETVLSLSWQKQPKNTAIMTYIPSQNLTIIGKEYAGRVQCFHFHTTVGIILSKVIASDDGNYSCLVTTTSPNTQLGTAIYFKGISSSSLRNPDNRHIYSLQLMLMLLFHLLQ